MKYILFILIVLTVFCYIKDDFDIIKYISISMITIILICGFISYSISYNNVASIIAFKEINYEIIKEQFIKNPDGVLDVNYSNGNLTTVINVRSQFIKSVLEYNSTLKFYKTYKNHWFVSFFITNVPDNLDYIDIQDINK